MSRRFPKKNFVPLGDLPTRRLGLSSSRDRELSLIRAWSRAAGPVLASKARPLHVRRGLLEILQRDDDESWRRTLLEVLPAVAAAIAREHPEWCIESVQLLSRDGQTIGPAAALSAQPFEAYAPGGSRRRSAGRGRSRSGTREPALDEARLQTLMHRYLERCSDTEGSSEG